MSGPTIILVGGEVTLDSGVTVDSRQPLADDEWDFVLREAVASSEGWWLFVKSLSDTILAEASPDAWALASVNKTVRRPKADGSLQRVPINKLLGDAFDLMGIAGKTGGAPEIPAMKSTARYRVLPYLLRMDDLQVDQPPTVVVSSVHETYDDGTDIVGQRPLDVFLSRWPEATIVLPHTPMIEAKVESVLANGVRRPQPGVGLASRTHPDESGRYVAARERLAELRQAQPYVLSGDLHVTYWMDQGRLMNPVDLDAALAFLGARYDLTFGLWDLARDPILRDSLLTKSAPRELDSSPAPVPAEVMESARSKAEERASSKAHEKMERKRVDSVIGSALSAAGWQKVKRGYQFPAGPKRALSPGAEPRPVVVVRLEIQKRQATVSLYELSRTGRAEAFLRAHADEIKDVTGRPPEPDTQTIVRFPDLGWDGDTEPWASKIPILQKLVELVVPQLGPLAEAGVADAAERSRRSAPMVVEIPWPQEPPAPRRSLWSKLRRPHNE